MAITIGDRRHGGSSSLGYGTAQSCLRGEVGAPTPSVMRSAPFEIGETRPPAPFHGELPAGSAIRARQQTPNVLTARNTAAAPVLNHALAAEGAREAARILRAARLRDLLAAIEEFWRASGSERGYWRGQTTYLLREWRRLHLEPERAAFQQAVARSRQRAS